MTVVSNQPAPLAATHRARIAIVTNSSWNAVNFRGGLIAALVSKGFAVTAITPDGPEVASLRALNCNHVTVAVDSNGTSVLRDVLLFARYLRAFGKVRPDVVLGFTVKPNVFGSLAAGCLAIPVVNNISGLGTAFLRGGWLTAVVDRLYALALRRSARVFFQNREDRDEFLRRSLVRHEQTEVIPGSGVDLKHFTPAPSGEAGGRPLVFLLVARLLWDKGVDEFVKAAEIVREVAPRMRFCLLGPAEDKNPAGVGRTAVDGWCRAGLVEYWGVAEDVRPHMNASDCVVLPSYREGTPRSLLEAAAMAKPLIATDVPGCRDVVDDGVNGFICAVRNPGDLADKILRVIALSSERRLAMGAAGRAKMQREYSEDLVIDRYVAAIEAACKRRGNA